MPGYGYVDAPSEAVSEARKLVRADPRHLKSASAHAVLHEGKLVAVIMLVQVQPQYADLPEVQRSAVPKLAQGMAGAGATVTRETIHTEKVVVAKADSAAIYAWYHNGGITMVIGGNGPDIRDFAEAYLRAAHAQRL